MGTDAYGAHGSETRDYKELGYGHPARHRR